MLGKPKPAVTFGHSAVRLEHNILVIGGEGKSNHEIWTYNLYTEQWKKYAIPHKEHAPPETLCACAVAIEQDVYMFGGETRSKKTNALWKLAGSSVKRFEWSNVPIQGSKPSPRERHSGWEYYYSFIGHFSNLHQRRTEDIFKKKKTKTTVTKTHTHTHIL